jgi:hypothetical protein
MNDQPIDDLHAPELIARLQTCGALVAAGAQSVDSLIAALRHPEIEVRWRAAVELGWIGDPRAVAPLVELAQNAPYDIRVNVMWALGQIGSPGVVDPLMAVLDANNAGEPDITYVAALALLRAGITDRLRRDLESPHEFAYRVAHAAHANLQYTEIP